MAIPSFKTNRQKAGTMMRRNFGSLGAHPDTVRKPPRAFVRTREQSAVTSEESLHHQISPVIMKAGDRERPSGRMAKNLSAFSVRRRTARGEGNSK